MSRCLERYLSAGLPPAVRTAKPVPAHYNLRPIPAACGMLTRDLLISLRHYWRTAVWAYQVFFTVFQLSAVHHTDAPAEFGIWADPAPLLQGFLGLHFLEGAGLIQLRGVSIICLLESIQPSSLCKTADFRLDRKMFLILIRKTVKLHDKKNLLSVFSTIHSRESSFF